jgi:hypothetical protein
MDSRPNATPDDAVGAARTALEKGRRAEATRLLASALAEDPHRSERLGLLDEVIAAADDPEQLVTEDELPLSSALRGVRAYILAGRGRVAEAVHQLLEVVGSRPDVLYLDWALAWMQRPEIAGQLDPGVVGAFLLSLAEQAPALASPHGGARGLRRVPQGGGLGGPSGGTGIARRTGGIHGPLGSLSPRGNSGVMAADFLRFALAPELCTAPPDGV